MYTDKDKFNKLDPLKTRNQGDYNIIIRKIKKILEKYDNYI